MGRRIVRSHSGNAMRITLPGLEPGGTLEPRFALGVYDANEHARFGANRSPPLSWNNVPEDARSLVLICVDTDAPTRPDDVNVPGRHVPVELPRADFYHWVMVDIPPETTGLAEGACSDGVVAGGKSAPPGPRGARQGINDYTGWFAGDAKMAGTYRGYDGPFPPWNDLLAHHYHFRLFATSLARCPVEGAFSGAEVERAIRGHVLARAEIVGTYTLNPELIP